MVPVASNTSIANLMVPSRESNTLIVALGQVANEYLDRCTQWCQPQSNTRSLHLHGAKSQSNTRSLRCYCKSPKQLPRIAAPSMVLSPQSIIPRYAALQVRSRQRHRSIAALMCSCQAIPDR
ncbi:hypothetical protein AVEN_105891-1 [Araneus ventricosus]|uniref:Uncharacterized protein n=1 Tax=Araneus ventricosus TaxID=182803 RepID=A0A4Y2MBJ6_ARAVE|nr:hypothetical protein AVEN_105891-1 [Araneus ventricosus]